MNTPKDLLDYLDNVLSNDALRRLDAPSLHRLENLLHHWYVLAGVARRAKLAAGKPDRPQDRTPPPADSFSLACPCHDEHAQHLGI